MRGDINFTGHNVLQTRVAGVIMLVSFAGLSVWQESTPLAHLTPVSLPVHTSVSHSGYCLKATSCNEKPY